MMETAVPMFEPLSEEEVAAAATAAKTKPQGDWRPILPVPRDRPRKLPRHPKHGKPSVFWQYRNATGRLLFLTCRFDLADGGKLVLPLTYCEVADGRREWRWKSPPAPRPLYGLDKLAVRPDAQALVAEGEKATDAAAKLFPDCVSVTSPGGCKAADKADWTPLKGRKVVVWPDFDKDGARYAKDVARLASLAGAAEVRVVKIPPGFPRRWDLADPPPPLWGVQKICLMSFDEWHQLTCR